MNVYGYKNITKDLISQEIDIRLSDLTSQGLVRSETEYRKVVDSLMSSFGKAYDRITNENNYFVQVGQVVSSKGLSALFGDLEADLRILYQELDNAKKVLDLSLERNKTFYRRIKTKIAGMYKLLNKFRETSFNKESGDYVFFEPFDYDSNMILRNLTIDRKSGLLHFIPVSSRSHNEPYDIEEVNVTLFPVDNKEGGVYDTTNPANTLSYNFESGDKSILKSGLWKVQMLTALNPQTDLDFLDQGYARKLRGVVAYVDITFSSNRIINELAVDAYGEFPLKILAVRSKNAFDGEWENLYKYEDDSQNLLSDYSADWIYFRNIHPVHSKVLRIIFQQENFSTVAKMISKIDEMTDRMVRDLVEKRYEKTTYAFRFQDEFPRAEDNNDIGTLYDEVMKVIEEEGHIDELENKITNLLIPKPTEFNIKIADWKIFNFGAWSIEPKTTFYSNSIGTYISQDPRSKTGFKLDKGAPTEATLYTVQEEPTAGMIQWSLLNDDNTIEIPIIPNNEKQRTEFLNMGDYYPLKNEIYRQTLTMKNKSRLVKLDFPVHPGYISEIEVFENGGVIYSADLENTQGRGSQAELYNSTEIYFPELELNPEKIYAIKYYPAILDTVQCWVLKPNKDSETYLSNGIQKVNLDVATGMVFANSETADTMAEYLTNINTKNLVDRTKGKSYTPVMMLCTKTEYDTWFQGGQVSAFMDEIYGSVEDIFETALNMPINQTLTKLTWLYKESVSMEPYSESGDSFTWAELPSAPPCMFNKRPTYVL